MYKTDERPDKIKQHREEELCMVDDREASCVTTEASLSPSLPLEDTISSAHINGQLSGAKRRNNSR